MPQLGPGGDRLNYNQLNDNEIALLENYKPSLIYGRSKPEAPDNFVPATVSYDKKVGVSFNIFMSYLKVFYYYIWFYSKGIEILWLFQANCL